MNALCLSGAGGAIGFLVGALLELNELYDHDIIVGVSSGAIVGIMQAVGKLHILEERLQVIVDEDIAKRRSFLFAGSLLTHFIGVGKPLVGLYDNSGLRSMLREELLGTTCNIDFTAISVNINTGGIAYWTVEKDTEIKEYNVDLIVSYVISSTAIPFAFSHEKIGGMHFVDGGVQTHTPIQPTKNLLPNADHINIITTAGRERPSVGNVRSFLDYVPALVSDMVTNVQEKDFLEFELKNRLGKAGVDGYTYYKNHIIKPTEELAPTIRFHHEFTKPDIEHGKERAKLILNNN